MIYRYSTQVFKESQMKEDYDEDEDEDDDLPYFGTKTEEGTPRGT